MAALSALPQGMTGGSAPAHDTLQRIGLAIFRVIYDAFLVKMRGGTDDAGDRWAPLSPVTVAIRQRRRGVGPPRKRSRYRKFTQNDLSPAQRRLRSITKGAGASYDKYGRDYEILHDRGRLLESLRPGSGSAEQVFEIADGRVIVGTNREGAARNHQGDPPKLPQRRLWPDPSDWPDEWWDQILEEVQAGVVDLVVQELRK